MRTFVKGLSRRTLRVLLLAAVQLLVAAVLLEVAIRILGPRTALRSLLYQPGEASHFEDAGSVEELLDQSLIGFAPFTESYGFVLNSRSLRTKEYQERKPPGATRVLAFGDSFTWASGGLPHGQHWTVVLEDRLRLALGHEVEVLRLGVPATGPAFQYRLWQLEGARLGPDLVVVGFFVGNDFVEHQGVAVTRNLREHSVSELVAERWLTYRAARNLYRVARGVARELRDEMAPDVGGRSWDHGGFELPEYAERFNPDRPTFTAERFLEIEARRMELCRDDRRAELGVLVERVGATLTAFQREVVDQGARFVVMIIPDEYQVEPELAAAAAAHSGVPLEAYDLGRPGHRLAELLAAEGVECLDLAPHFIRVATRMPLYRPRDTHWNRDGNRLAGEVLASFVTGADGGDRMEPVAISANDFETGRPEGFAPEVGFAVTGPPLGR
jgi:hypothetical protein